MAVGVKGWNWIWAALGVLGVLVLCGLVWVAAPLVEINGYPVLAGTSVRLALVALVLLMAGLATGLRVLLRARAAAALDTALVRTVGTDDGDDAAALDRGMRDALATLRKTKGVGRSYLYQLPWYMIIGRPSSGKTTALVNSGLRFPLSAGERPTPVAGSGSTQFCDWYFTENAVLIDTAGRYTTQDEDATRDSSAWMGFLKLLARHRPQQPINGVLIALSLTDLAAMTRDELNAYAVTVRKRLLELRETLAVDFPIYVLLTKADLVAGFREAFGHLNEEERRAVWGATFPPKSDIRAALASATPEFDLLMERLNDQMPDRLQGEPDLATRVKLFGLPAQLTPLKGPLTTFLAQVFEPTRFHASATLRGVYLTSATQNGTPFDQLIGAMTAEVGTADGVRASLSQIGKSFFLTDLLEKVIIPEAGWVSTNRAAIQRGRVLHTITFGALALSTLVIIGLWGLSYTRNKQLIAATETDLADYRTAAEPMLKQTSVADTNLAKVLPLLHKLRYLPVGYGERDAPMPLADRLGLSQAPRLRSSAEALYGNALERLFRPRLVLRLEEQIEANRANPGFLYEALKVYLMLGGQVRTDKALVTSWMRRDWADTLFPGAANASGRQALADHLAAMLDLDNVPLVQLNGPLVEDTQRTLARLSVADRAFAILRSDAAAQTQRDWVASRAAGPDGNLVFTTADGRDLDAVRIPAFFTYDGFQHSFIDKLGEVGDQVRKDGWVLGAAGEQNSVQAQFATLYADLSTRYTQAFVDTWTKALARLRLRPLTADKPRFLALAAAAAPTSPLKQILESIRDETALTRERGAPEATGGTPKPNRAAALVADLSAKANPQGSGAPPPDDVPGAAIEARFKPFAVAVEGEPGRRPIDAILQNLGDIAQTLQVAAANPDQAAQANAALAPQVAALRGNAARLPAPFSDMLRAAADEVQGDVSSAQGRQIAQAMAEQVTPVCQGIVADRYPFAKASGRDVALGDFGRLFSPGGILDGFFAKTLAPFVDQSQAQWTTKAEAKLGRPLSPGTLASFQAAAAIRDTFFATGGQMPSVSLTVTPVTLSGDANSAKLDVGATSLTTERGSASPGAIQWPGAGAERSAITLDLGFFSHPVSLEKMGPWSLFHLVDAAQVLDQGDKVVASFSVEGKDVTYQFGSQTTRNPLSLPALRDFKCPAGL